MCNLNYHNLPKIVMVRNNTISRHVEAKDTSYHPKSNNNQIANMNNTKTMQLLDQENIV